MGLATGHDDEREYVKGATALLRGIPKSPRGSEGWPKGTRPYALRMDGDMHASRQRDLSPGARRHAYIATGTATPPLSASRVAAVIYSKSPKIRSRCFADVRVER